MGFRGGGEGTFCPECCGEAPTPAPETAGEWRLSSAEVNRLVTDSLTGVRTTPLTCIDTPKHYGAIVILAGPAVAAQIVADHHAARVQAMLVEALRDEWEALRVWLSNKNNVSDEVREGMLISRTKRFPEYARKETVWGAQPVAQAQRDLACMAQAGILDRGRIGLNTNWQPGFPKWVWGYSLADNHGPYVKDETYELNRADLEGE